MFTVPSMRGFSSKPGFILQTIPNISFNGTVNDAVESADSIYIGGNFTAASNNVTKAAVVFDKSTATSLYSTKFNSSVITFTVDTSFTYYVGYFTEYNGTTVNKIVRISNTTGVIDTSFNYFPASNSWGASNFDTPQCVAIDGDNLYIGGSFSSFKSNPSNKYLIKMSKSTGVVDNSFLPNLNGSVSKIVVDGTDLYISGNFTTVNGTTRQYLAKIDKATGALNTTFDTSNAGGSEPYSFSVDSTSIYIWGGFTSYKGLTRQNLVKIDKNTAAVDTAFDTSSGFGSIVRAVAIDGNDMYVGGNFTNYKGNTRYYFAKINKDTAAEVDASGTGWSTTNYIFGNTVWDIVVDGTSLYVGGDFTHYKGRNNVGRIIKIDKITGNEIDAAGTNWSAPTLSDSYISQIFIQSSRIFAIGASITIAGGFPVNRLVKVNKSTNLIDTAFNSNLGSGFNGEVFCLCLDSSDLYVGGSFDSYKGNTRQRIVKIDKTTAAEVDANGTGFAITTGFTGNGTVNTFLIDGTSLYVGGDFSGYKGASNNMSSLVRLDKTSGNPIAGFSTHNVVRKFVNELSYGNGQVLTLALDGNNLYVGGRFVTFNNKCRYNILKLDKTTGNEVDANGSGFSKPNAGFDGYINKIVLNGNDLYIGGAFKGQKLNSLCSGTSLISKTTGGINSSITVGYDATMGRSVRCAVVSGDYAYLGGEFISWNGEDAYGIVKIYIPTGERVAAFDTTTGVDILPGSTGNSGSVECIVLDGSNLYIGGTFTSYKGTSARAIAKIDATTGALITAFDTTTGFLNQNSWNPTETNPGIVSTLALSADGLSLYVGGSFGLYKGTTRQNLAKISTTNAALDTTFNTAVGTNNQVLTLALDNTLNVLYAGGWFSTYKGNNRNHIIKINTSTAAEIDNNGSGLSVANIFNGSVNKIKIDASSNVYCAGSFLMFNNTTTRQRLAKFSAGTNSVTLDSTFDTSSGFNNVAEDFFIDGNDLYVCGGFSNYKGIDRYNIVKINKDTAVEVSTNNPFVNKYDATDYGPNNYNSTRIRTIVNSPYGIIIGPENSFPLISYKYKGNRSTDSACLAKINKTTAISSAISNSSLEKGIGFDLASHRVTMFSWRPNGVGTEVRAIKDLTIDGNNIFASGNFSVFFNFKNGSASSISVLDKTNGSITNVVLSKMIFDQQPSCCVVDGDYLYLAGKFQSYKNSIFSHNIIKIHIPTSEIDLSFSTLRGFLQQKGKSQMQSSPDSSGTINKMIINGDNLYVCGSFNYYQGETRQNILKLNKITGNEADPMNTGFSTTSGFNGSVNDMEIDASGDLYAVGSFTSYKGTTRQYVAKINGQTAALDTTFDTASGFNSTLNCITLDSTSLYVGGSFGLYKGTTRQNLAKINKTNAALDTTFNTATAVNSQTNCITLDGNNLYIGGYFTSYKGQSRGYIVKIDKTTAAEVDASGTGFSTNSGFNTTVMSILSDGLGSLYVNGQFNSYKGTTRPHLAKINTSDATLDTGFNASIPHSGSVVFPGRMLLLSNDIICPFLPTSQASNRYNVARVFKFSLENYDISFNTKMGLGQTGFTSNQYWANKILKIPEQVAGQGARYYVFGSFLSYETTYPANGFSSDGKTIARAVVFNDSGKNIFQL